MKRVLTGAIAEIRRQPGMSLAELSLIAIGLAWVLL